MQHLYYMRMPNTYLAVLTLHNETETKRVERMRADFLANASHELRSPLASLIGFIDTLRGHAKEDVIAQQRFLDIMALQADRMGRLISDLLSLSRIEINEHVPPTGEADLSLILKDVLDGLSIQANNKGVNLCVDMPAPGLYPVTGDRDQMHQVFQNLVDNALKYSPSGSDVSISLEINRRFDQLDPLKDAQSARLVLLKPDRFSEKYFVCIRVRDNGPGIRREFLPRLAERFYRVEGQKSGDRLGTGLGLAIVKHIVNRHRGGMVVESLSDNTPMSHETKKSDAVFEDGQVIALPPQASPTYTAFSLYLPQTQKYRESTQGPSLVVLQDEPQAPKRKSKLRQ